MTTIEFYETLHDFEEYLARSETPAAWMLYLGVIAQLHPDLTDWDRIRDLVSQKRGNDCVVHFPGGRDRIQFKVRYSDYGDLLIEDRHEFFDGRTKAGWIRDRPGPDTMAYIIEPKRLAYVVPFAGLRSIYLSYRDEWRILFGEVKALNKDYYTVNVPVPLSSLRDNGVNITKLIL